MLAMNNSLSFNEALELMIKHNPNKKPEFLRDQLISGILSGELPLKSHSFDDFYRWCKHYVDKDENSTNPAKLG